MLLTAVATTLVFVYVVYRRRVTVCTPALADTEHFSLDWLTAHDLRPLDIGRPASHAGVWQTVVVEGLSAAVDLLDALEAAGYEERELVIQGLSSFAVRWRD